MLLSPRLYSLEARGPMELLQGALEALVGLFLEGRIQAALLVGEPEASGVLLGYYQPAPRSGGEGVWRRLTGGLEARLGPSSWYVALVFASESLEEAVWVGERMADCLGGGAWGATRIGPRRLAAGVVEVVSEDAGGAVECARSLVAKPGASLENLEIPGSAYRIARAYSHPRWRLYEGVEPLPLKGVAARGPYRVRVGLSVYEGFISAARLDGSFMAAPPNEPYNALNSIQGMPVGPQALIALETRLEGLAELYGIQAGDFIDAFKAAAGLHDEEGPG